jgi:diguanylate cyclase (GGDEF)-like protein
MASDESPVRRLGASGSAPPAAQGIGARLAAFVDSWAPADDAADLRRRPRGLLLTRISFFAAGLSLLLAPFFWVSYPSERQIPVINALYAGLLLVGPVLMKRTGSTEIATHWMLANALLVLGYDSVLLGGVESPAFAWFVALPFGAALFGGRRCAAFWGYATGLVMVSLIALQIDGRIGDDTVDIAMVANRGVSMAMLALIIGLFAWLQEREISAMIERLRDERARFRQAATRDPLTGLLNRSLLADHLTRLLARTRRNGSRGALYYGDLDGFKAVNDEWGHFVGDLLLKGLAERLNCETRGGDTVLRVGGDEFVLLVEDLEDREAAAVVAEKVVALVQRPFEIDGQRVSVGLSLGIVMIEGQLARPDQLLDAADAAMYAAKRGGQAFCFA